MVQYINKDALVAEIKRRKNIYKKVVWDLRTQENKDYYQGKAEAYNELLAILDTMQKEPKQCMYSKDNYTEEDRKVLCEGCEEKCEFNQVKESAILQHKEETCKESGDSLTLDGVITFDYYDGDKSYGCVAHDSFCLEDFGLKDRDEVKILILKNNEL